ncbi:RNA binding metal dependent phosphohydrolase [human gut metagenome]|uniref:RNA binding metal dependent phosphohydrolase n=1 Tax=human gut metagenome TaxID=408170 RepID=K1RHN8_9ZZZZ
MLEKARKEAEKIKREGILEQKEETHRLKLEFDKELKEKKVDLKETEDRLLQREKNMDKRDELYQKRETLLDEKEERLNNKFDEIQDEKSKVEELKNEQLKLLQEIANFSKEEAKELLMDEVKQNMSKEVATYIKEQEQEAKMLADKNAKNLIVTAMQRYAADIANEQTITVVNLPNDDMKGRIIGREGRNIRTIEAITGVDLIIDDTPEAVVISSFDPLRREIARLTLETLIKDGRIHPTRIEEIYDKTSKDLKQKMMEYGNDALFELGITKMDTELVELVGKLHFRTSYGQNALTHSIEVAELAGVLAGEFDEDVNLAKRAGLLHDIGKAIDHDLEGSHVELGSQIAKKYHENEVVINAIESHHGDTEATSIISSIVAIADSLSASRPGARNDSLENYIQRLSQLEAVGNEIEGVEKSFAVQAGRELRVIVKPEEVDDLKAHTIAREIKEKVETTLKYPGTIKITVVRETRAQEEAK